MESQYELFGRNDALWLVCTFGAALVPLRSLSLCLVCCVHVKHDEERTVVSSKSKLYVYSICIGGLCLVNKVCFEYLGGQHCLFETVMDVVA
jgi:hypothetical protein